MASTLSFLAVAAILAFVCSPSMATDPTQLQDFCVADNTTGIFVNGFLCKNPKQVTAEDFFFAGLRQPGNTANPVGSSVTPAFVAQLPGLNTLGISAARIDFAPYGLNPPHYHPRGSEVLVVQQGSLLVGFVTSNNENKLFTKFNIGKTYAVAIAALSSQNPGVVTVANAVFGSNPKIDPYVLAKAFQLDLKTVQALQAKFWTNN
ncbi:hypothetical protein HPP92_027642 [Vanilla planifolia]|uniref:Cupin type-1 domain-containing protein n=1 Tax=Vanilla planifolia TaxID=51239 RepID=A0A835PB27_VANPL|nr:hypothetical protein HPP92_027642 [Vanilla planifolia]